MNEDRSAGGQQAALPPRTGRFGDDKDPNLGKDTQFRKGQSGNPAGRKKGVKLLSTVIQELMDDERFIERLSEKIKTRVVDAEDPDPEFQGTPMKAIISTAIVEAMDPTMPYKARAAARDYLGRFGYGTKIDLTSDGERISESPKVISIINARPGDAALPEAEAS